MHHFFFAGGSLELLLLLRIRSLLRWMECLDNPPTPRSRSEVTLWLMPVLRGKELSIDVRLATRIDLANSYFHVFLPDCRCVKVEDRKGSPRLLTRLACQRAMGSSRSARTVFQMLKRNQMIRLSTRFTSSRLLILPWPSLYRSFLRYYCFSVSGCIIFTQLHRSQHTRIHKGPFYTLCFAVHHSTKPYIPSSASFSIAILVQRQVSAPLHRTCAIQPLPATFSSLLRCESRSEPLTTMGDRR